MTSASAPAARAGQLPRRMEAAIATKHEYPAGCIEMPGGCLHNKHHPILDAAYLGDHEGCIALLQRDLTLVQVRVGGRAITPWHVAAEAGHVHILRVLVDTIMSRQDAVMVLNSSIRRLFSMERSARQLVLKFLERECKGGYTPLMLAAQNGHIPAIAYLLSVGGDPWKCDGNGQSPLHHAAVHNQCEAIHALCAAVPGPPPNPWLFNLPDTCYVDVADSCGWTPLHCASFAGKLDAVKTLLSHNANIVARTQVHNLRIELLPTGLTPLHLAAFKGDLPVAKALLRAYFEGVSDLVTPETAQLSPREVRRRRRAHPDPRLILTRTGRLAYHFARRMGHSHMLEWLDPTIPLRFLFGGSDDAMDSAGVAVMVGVPRLAVLAATALHSKLRTDLEATESLLEVKAAMDSAAAPSAALSRDGTAGGSVRRPSLLHAHFRVHPEDASAAGGGAESTALPTGPPAQLNLALPPPQATHTHSSGRHSASGSASGTGGGARDVLDPGQGLGTFRKLRQGAKRPRPGLPDQDTWATAQAELRRMGIHIPQNVDEGGVPVAVFVNRAQQPRPVAAGQLNSTWSSGAPPRPRLPAGSAFMELGSQPAADMRPAERASEPGGSRCTHRLLLPRRPLEAVAQDGALLAAQLPPSRLGAGPATQLICTAPGVVSAARAAPEHDIAPCNKADAIGSTAAAAAAAALEATGDDDTCPVCLDHAPNVTLAPCHHQLCAPCAKDLLRRHQLTPALCPYCRTVIAGLGLLPR